MEHIANFFSGLSIGFFLLYSVLALCAVALGIFGLITIFFVNPILGLVVLVLAMCLPPLGVINLLQGSLLFFFHYNLAEQFMQLIS